MTVAVAPARRKPIRFIHESLYIEPISSCNLK